jgi:hypoxanthine phosphoribosyltransferase
MSKHIYKMNWGEFECVCKNLARQISDDKDNFSVLYPISKNSIIAAQKLSEELRLPIVTTLSEIKKDDKILLVDLAIDSGKTLKKHKAKKAVLFATINTTLDVTYYAGIKDQRWIKFPWEIEKEI